MQVLQFKQIKKKSLYCFIDACQPPAIIDDSAKNYQNLRNF
jgi:hypothetical protein